MLVQSPRVPFPAHSRRVSSYASVHWRTLLSHVTVLWPKDPRPMHTACSNSGTCSAFVNEYGKTTLRRSCATRCVLPFHTGTTARNTKSSSMKSQCNPPTNGATPMLYILDSVLNAYTELLHMSSNAVNSTNSTSRKPQLRASDDTKPPATCSGIVAACSTAAPSDANTELSA